MSARHSFQMLLGDSVQAGYDSLADVANVADSTPLGGEFIQESLDRSGIFHADVNARNVEHVAFEQSALWYFSIESLAIAVLEYHSKNVWGCKSRSLSYRHMTCASLIMTFA